MLQANQITASQYSRSISSSLLIRVKSKDAAAWKRVVELFSEIIYGWFRYKWHVPESDVPDLVQDVFASAFAGISNFERTTSKQTFRGWLWRVARNKRADYFRKQRPVQLPDGMILPAQEIDSEADTQSEQIELLHRVLEMIRRDFSEASFEVFYLCEIEGRDTAEVAQKFGMKKSTVREARRRVMKRLREEFEELVGDFDDVKSMAAAKLS